MLIEIHIIQNHAPANLNRDDLGAPKTCFFGGVLRSRISSQCLKRSIRLSDEFKTLLGGIRTRQLSKLITDKMEGNAVERKCVTKILDICGIKSKKDDKSDMLVYTTFQAIEEMAQLLQNGQDKENAELANEFGELISKRIAVPDMALSGRMLETGKLKNTTVEASLQVAHAVSTHEARPEVDYYVAADDVPGDDAGAGFLDEAMFSSACFYKYYCIDFEQLKKNLAGFSGNVEHLAAHTVGAFIRGAAKVNPTGKQNSYAANNLPDGILIEFKNSPVSYANAFADPVVKDKRDVIAQSIAQLGHYVHDLDTGYGKPEKRFWFSPNLRYPLNIIEEKQEIDLAESNVKSLDKLIPDVITALGFEWNEVQKSTVNSEIKS